MKEDNVTLSNEEIGKIIREAHNSDGFFGIVKAVTKLHEQGVLSNNNFNKVVSPTVKTPIAEESTMVVHKPNAVESPIIEVPVVTSESNNGASIYRETARKLVEADQTAEQSVAANEKGKARVLTNPAVPGVQPKETVVSSSNSNFADAQIVSPGSNTNNHQIL